MTKREFLQVVPGTINHIPWGYGELEIVVNRKELKGVCYRHTNKTASCGTYAASWAELYVKFSEHLIKEGFMESVPSCLK